MSILTNKQIFKIKGNRDTFLHGMINAVNVLNDAYNAILNSEDPTEINDKGVKFDTKVVIAIRELSTQINSLKRKTDIAVIQEDSFESEIVPDLGKTLSKKYTYKVNGEKLVTDYEKYIGKIDPIIRDSYVKTVYQLTRLPKEGETGKGRINLVDDLKNITKDSKLPELSKIIDSSKEQSGAPSLSCVKTKKS